MLKTLTNLLTVAFILGIVMAAASISEAGLDDKSLVLYLSFDEGKGDVTKDGSQYGQDGSLTNKPSWVDGKVGKALEFDGTKGQYVQVPITDTLQLTEAFSAAFWVKRDAAQIRDWNYMVAAGTLKWAVIFNNDENVYVWSTSGGQWAQRDVSTEPLPADWTHVAVTYDTKSNVSLYFDGKLVGEGAKPPPVDEIDGSIMIGARHPGDEFFTGAIDEVYLFNRIISDVEMQEIMSGQFLSVEPAGKLATTWGALKQRWQ